MKFRCTSYANEQRICYACNITKLAQGVVLAKVANLKGQQETNSIEIVMN